MKATDAEIERDPRGPLVKSVSVERRADGTRVNYSCGHTGNHSQHFHHEVSDVYRCFECLKPTTNPKGEAIQ